LGVPTQADAFTIEALAEPYADLLTARAALAARGALTSETTTPTGAESLHGGGCRQAVAGMAHDLRTDPASRSTVNDAPTDDDAVNEFAQFMKVIAATATGRRTPSSWIVRITPFSVHAATPTESTQRHASQDPGTPVALSKACTRYQRRVDIERIAAPEMRRGDLGGQFGHILPFQLWPVKPRKRRGAKGGRAGRIQHIARNPAT
jgi:hypothetical protein